MLGDVALNPSVRDGLRIDVLVCHPGDGFKAQGVVAVDTGEHIWGHTDDAGDAFGKFPGYLEAWDGRDAEPILPDVLDGFLPQTGSEQETGYRIPFRFSPFL